MAKVDYSKEVCIDIDADEYTEVMMFRMANDEIKVTQKTNDCPVCTFA